VGIFGDIGWGPKKNGIGILLGDMQGITSIYIYNWIVH